MSREGRFLPDTHEKADHTNSHSIPYWLRTLSILRLKVYRKKLMEHAPLDLICNIDIR